MKRLFALLLLGLLLFGCTGGPAATPTPTATIAATATPSPTPDPATASAIEAASESIPVGEGIAALTGVTAKAPEQYVIQTESQFTLDVALNDLTQWDFQEQDFGVTLKKVATAGKTRKTMSWQSSTMGGVPDQFHIVWQEQDTYEDVGAVVDVTLSKNGGSSVCAAEAGKKPECFEPSKEQVDALWTALTSNALEQTIQLIAPGVQLNTLLKVTPSDKTTYLGRACQAYGLELTEAGLELVNEIGGHTIADLKGSICVDEEYGFPLYQNIQSQRASVDEHVVSFSTAKVGILQYAYRYTGLCTRPGGPCDNNVYTNPFIVWAPYTEPFEKVSAATVASCKEPGRITLNVGECVRYGYGHGFILKSANSGRLALIKFDQNLNAFGEFQIRPSGIAKKDQYDIGGDFYDRTLALAVISIGQGSADLDFISFEQDWENPGVQYKRKYSRGFADPAKPMADEAYYAIFSPGSCQSEGLQKYGNSDCVDLKNGAKVAFYWYYPEPYSESSMAGRLDTHVTAFVYSPDETTGVKAGKAYVLELGKPVQLGSFQKKYPSTATLELVKADLSRDGSIQVKATSESIPAPTATPTGKLEVTTPFDGTVHWKDHIKLGPNLNAQIGLIDEVPIGSGPQVQIDLVDDQGRTYDQTSLRAGKVYEKNGVYMTASKIELIRTPSNDFYAVMHIKASGATAKAALKTCVRQVPVASSQTLAKTADCKIHFIDSDNDLSFAGNAAVSFDVPPGAQKVSVDIGYNAGALHCNKVQVNGQTVLDQSGQAYCSQVKAASECPGTTAGTFLKTAAIPDGTKTIRIDHGFQVFYVGKGTTLGEYSGSRLQGTMRYQATQCASGDFEIGSSTATVTPTVTPAPTISPTVSASPKPTTTVTSTPVPTASLKSCEMPVYFEMLRQLTQNLRCYNDDGHPNDYVSNPYYTAQMTATYALPAGVQNAKYKSIEYHVNDACEKVTVNGVNVADRPCTLPWKGGNCPMSHDGYGVLAPGGVSITGDKVTVTASYADFYGGKGDNGGITVRGTLSYQAPSCPATSDAIVVKG